MSTLSAAAATVHFPYITAWPERASAVDRASALSGFERLGRAFRSAGVDTVVAFTSEHIVNLQPRLAPAFTIGRSHTHPVLDETHFNLPKPNVPGDGALADYLLAELYAGGFDPAHASELELDHGTVLPLTLMGMRDVAVVPILINSILPPLPSLRRCRDLGRAIGAAVERCPLPRRVGFLATGGLSHTVGAPNVDRNDPEFDRSAIEAFLDGNVDRICALPDARLDEAGNGTHEIRNWIALAAAAGAFRPRVVTTIPYARGWNTGVHQLLWDVA